MCKSGGNNNSPSIFVSTSRGSEIMKMSWISDTNLDSKTGQRSTD
jgi:hypothetical protein